MSVSKQELFDLVDSLPDPQIPAVIAFLSEQGDEEIIDAPAAERRDAALAEPADGDKEPRPVD